MTTPSRRSRWAKRAGIPVALMVMGGIGVTLAMPASAAASGFGTGFTPEAATQAAASDCTGQGLDPGSIIEQKSLPDGGWEVKMECVKRTNPIPSGVNGQGIGATPEIAHGNAKRECTLHNPPLMPGNLVGMDELEDGTFKATVECLAP